MCGILGLLSRNILSQEQSVWFGDAFPRIQRRGPDCSLMKHFDNCILGFHRLSIIGNDSLSNRILHDNTNTIFLICNGEIYNYKELYKKYNFNPITHSDCEIIIHLYTYYTANKFDFRDMIQELDGVFAFVLWDSIKMQYIVARDRVGVRPLYYLNVDNTLVVGSEGKTLVSYPTHESTDILPFPPGHFMTHSMDIPEQWTSSIPRLHVSLDETMDMLKSYFIRAVQKRLHSDRPIGFLLSGGLDSSLVVSVAKSLLNTPIHTFSIGFQGSADLHHSKTVADFLGTIHHEVIITENDIQQVLNDVVYCLESYDITTIRASVPMFLLSKYISTNTDIRVIFSGEGSDELFGGYLYFLSAPNFYEFQKETERLVHDLHRYDVLRSDRTTAYWGLELRVPFLDTDFVSFVLGTDPMHKFPKHTIEKWLLRSTFKDYLPDSITWRQKEAFSDGVGKQSMAYLKKMGESYGGERHMYKQFYTCHGFDSIRNITSYWMPQWHDGIDDPSATVLSHHHSNN